MAILRPVWRGGHGSVLRGRVDVEAHDRGHQSPAFLRQQAGAAVDSSTIAAFCCVTESISPIAILTWLRLWACCSEERAMTSTTVLTSDTLPMIRCRALPVSSTSTTPERTCSIADRIRALTSDAASAERCASARTSDATTAKPLPSVTGPRRFDTCVEGEQVGLKAMPSMTVMISRSRGWLVDAVHRGDRFGDDLPPFSASSRASVTARFAWLALAAPSRTPCVISPTAAAVSRRLAACCSLRADRLSVAWRISSIFERMDPALAANVAGQAREILDGAIEVGGQLMEGGRQVRQAHGQVRFGQAMQPGTDLLQGQFTFAVVADLRRGPRRGRRRRRGPCRPVRRRARCRAHPVVTAARQLGHQAGEGGDRPCDAAAEQHLKRDDDADQHHAAQDQGDDGGVDGFFL